MQFRVLLLCVLPFSFGLAQDIPRPPKADVPYLIHAGSLVETEVGEATEEADEKETRYAVAGATSSARTPRPME